MANQNQLRRLAVFDSRTEDARLLLITGTPGSGKRMIGNLFVDERAYVHVDLDNLQANRRFVGRGLETFREELEANIEPGQPMVVTWTPAPNEALPFVAEMQSEGFDWVWLDGDRGAAFGTFFTELDGVAPPRFVDPFQADGTFRPLATVMNDVLEGGEVLAPAVRRARQLVPRRARTGVAAALAFSAVAAAALAAFFVVGSGSGDRLGGLGVQSADAIPAALPKNGVLVKGRSLAGVKLGDSKQDVRSQWGHDFTVCTACRPTTWIYSYRDGDPVGAGVKFRNGHVTAVFTLGMTFGWRTQDGVRVGDVLDPEMSGRWRSCSGYSAKAKVSGRAVTSVLTVGPTVYGFSLSRPSESVCL